MNFKGKVIARDFSSVFSEFRNDEIISGWDLRDLVEAIKLQDLTNGDRHSILFVFGSKRIDAALE